MRRPWLACLLSVLFPGLGQLYAGEPVRGVMALLWVVVLLPPAMNALLVPMSTGPGSVLGALAIGLVLYLLVALDAWGRARVHRERPARRWQRWWVYLLFVVAGIGVSMGARTWILPTLWYQQFRIPTDSMAPTLIRGDRVVAEMHGLRLERLRRGDVVLYRAPLAANAAPEQRRPIYLKRLIGLPGDAVEMRDGRLLLDGESLTNPGTADQAVECHGDRSWRVLLDPRMRDFGPVIVPEGHVFVVGDHRFSSRDSREYGPIPAADVRGRLIRVWWSADLPIAINESPPPLPDIGWERIGSGPWVEAKAGCPGE